MKLSSFIPVSLNLILLSNLPRVLSQEEAQTYLSTESEDDSACYVACTALLTTLPLSTHYSNTLPLPVNYSTSFYTTQQSSIIPACILTPSSSLEVSLVLKIIAQHSCHFAVKSGGHALFAGASNSDGGITIDLRLLNGIEILEGGNMTRVGTGNKWNDVYAVLEPLKRTVVGGRNGDVGVGGFILGGGISFLSRTYGWSCDTVLAFDLVLPNGTLTTVTPTSSPTLFIALRGGGSNFGIVTSFDLKTFPQGQVWGGSNLYLLSPTSVSCALSAYQPIPSPDPSSDPSTPSETQPKSTSFLATALNLAFKTLCLFKICTTPLSLSRAFTSALESGKDDPGAQMILALSWGYEAYIAVVTLVHSKPPLRWNLSVPPPAPPGSAEAVAAAAAAAEEMEEGEKGEESEIKPRQPGNKTSLWSYNRKDGFVPRTFSDFNSLPRVWNTNKVQNFTDVYKEVASYNVAGYRQLWGAISFHLPPSSSSSSSSSHKPSQPDLISQIITIWIQEIASLKRIPSVQPSIVFQPLYPEFFAHSASNGGNAMNIDPYPEKGPLILFSLAFRWLFPTDDQAMEAAGSEIYARIEDLLSSYPSSPAPNEDENEDLDLDLTHDFIYQNYASPHQYVFAGYGPSNDRGAWRESLREVQRSVDPEGMWRRLRRGYFTL